MSRGTENYYAKRGAIRWSRALILAAACGGWANAGPAKASDIHVVAPLVFTNYARQDCLGVRYMSRGPGYGIMLTDQGMTLVLANAAKYATPLRITAVGADPKAIATAEDVTPAKVNYLIGNDPSKWRIGVSTYARVAYKGVLPGVDLVYYGQGTKLEYDFRIAPGADARAVGMAVTGKGWTTRLTAAGDLEIAHPEGSLQFDRPFAYQLAADGSKQRVDASYRLLGKGRYGFRLGRYDHSRELVIDPTLVWATFYGGSNQDYGDSVAVGPDGSVYVAGSTASTDLPTTAGSFQPRTSENIYVYGATSVLAAFIAKFNSTGTQLLAATYLGGSSHENMGGIAVDPSGNVTVAGSTWSSDFPTKNAYQSTCGPTATIDRFYCTDTTYSSCQTSGNGPQSDAFVAKLNGTLSTLIYSTFLGGSVNDWANSVAVDGSGNAYVTGGTQSYGDTHAGCPANGPYCGNDPPDQFGFPTTSNAFFAYPPTGGCPNVDPSQSRPSWAAWVAKLSSSGGLLYSSYFAPNSTHTSGGENTSNSIALDSPGNVYVAGQTSDTGFPSIGATVTNECVQLQQRPVERVGGEVQYEQ